MISGYVLRRDGDGRYVARPGNEHSYTQNIAHAQIFPTPEDADCARCENERVIALAVLFNSAARRTAREAGREKE